MTNTRTVMNLACGTFAAGLIVAASPALAVTYFDGWVRIDDPPASNGEGDFINSYTKTENGILITDVIEDYYRGIDGKVYVQVVYNLGLVGAFLTGYDKLPGSGDFPDWSPPSLNDYQAIHTPEPESWALMLIGLGLTGAALRRRGVLRGAASRAIGSP